MSGTPASAPAGSAACSPPAGAGTAPGQPPGRRRSAVAAAAFAVVATLFVPGEWLELQRDDFNVLQILTCHFVHWTHEQLAWDALAFTALAIACARRDRRAFHATLLASIVLIPLAVLAFAPEVVAYRGLSGLASAMFALLLMLERERLTWPVVLCAIAFGAKLTFEAVTGGTVFVNGMGDGVVSVPVAHLAGAFVGVIGGMKRKKRALVLAPLLLTACVTTINHATWPDRVPPRNCAGGALAGVWRSARPSVFGPAWARLVLRPDCRYTMRIQLLAGRVLEHGVYAIEGDRIRFFRGHADTVWAFRRETGYLMLEEAPGQWYPYTFSPCGSSSSCS